MGEVCGGNTLLWSVPLFPLAHELDPGVDPAPVCLGSVWGPVHPAQHQSTKKQGWGLGGKSCSQGPRGHRRSGRPGGTLPPRLPFTLPTEVSSRPPPPAAEAEQSPGVTGFKGCRGEPRWPSHAFRGRRLGRPFSPYQLSPPGPAPPATPTLRSILLLVWPPSPTRTWASPIPERPAPRPRPRWWWSPHSAMSAVREPRMLK